MGMRLETKLGSYHNREFKIILTGPDLMQVLLSPEQEKVVKPLLDKLIPMRKRIQVFTDSLIVAGVPAAFDRPFLSIDLKEDHVIVLKDGYVQKRFLNSNKESTDVKPNQ